MKRFATLFVACSISMPAAALAVPSIVPIIDAEGTGIRVVSDIALSSSERPRPKPDFELLAAQRAEILEAQDSPSSPDASMAAFLASTARYMAKGDFVITPGNKMPRRLASLGFSMAGETPPLPGSIKGAAPDAASFAANTPIEQATIGRLISRYASEPSEDLAHLERLFMIADGKRPSRIDADGGVNFVASAYEVPQPAPTQENPYQAQQQPAPPANQSGVTNEQLAAFIIAMASRPPSGASYVTQQPAPQRSAPAPLNGVPGLDYRGEDLPQNAFISDSDIPTGSSPFSPEVLSGQPYPGQAYPAQPSPELSQFAQIAAALTQPQAPQQPINSIIGDGGNILLAGWKVGLTGSGGVGIYIEGDPGSIVEISEGMVVGSLGSVENISFQNGEIIASFTSGESLRGPARIVMSPGTGISGSQMGSDRMVSG